MSIQLLHGDCRELLKSLPDQSIDSIVTDPPYELGFMGKKWDASGIAYDIKVWQECLRVLKPGGHLLAFGGTRTYHRMTCAIEDAGFEIRDCIMWVYGSGFPKSHDVSKGIDRALGAEREVTGTQSRAGGGMKSSGGSIAMGASAGYSDSAFSGLRRDAPATEAAKQWQGWGSALKPAVEPIVVARKPLDGTIADNVLRHGTGGINIDGCRVGTGEYSDRQWLDIYRHGRRGINNNFVNNFDANKCPKAPLGRWPANLIHDGSDEVVGLFPQSNGDSPFRGPRQNNQSLTSGLRGIYGKFQDKDTTGYADSGSAARFFYCAKTSPSERGDNSHPTVKPLALMRYLCRLVTPPSGTVLDPFAGSGSTMVAARQEGLGIVGCELEAAHIEIIKRRLRMPPEPEVEQAQEVREQKSKSMQLRLF